MFDIFEHGLVPQHTVVSESEKKDLIKKYGLRKLNQLPRILAGDKVVKVIGAKPGDVIKITRKSSVAGETVYYRVVVEE